MENFDSETDSDYTSYWRDWVSFLACFLLAATALRLSSNSALVLRVLPASWFCAWKLAWMPQLDSSYCHLLVMHVVRICFAVALWQAQGGNCHLILDLERQFELAKQHSDGRAAHDDRIASLLHLERRWHSY